MTDKEKQKYKEAKNKRDRKVIEKNIIKDII